MTRPSGQTDELIYAPPWREWVGDELRGEQIVTRWREYGPSDTVEFAKEKAEWLERREGGGLWDVSEELAQRARTGRMRRERDPRVMTYVRQHSEDVPPKELECYLLIWEEGLGLRRTARRMGVEVPTVRNWVRRLTARVSE